MTAIVGVKGKKGVLLAGDSQMSGYNSNREVLDTKVFLCSDVLGFAYCGWPRLAQIVMYHLGDFDDPPLGMDEQKWAIKEFIPRLRDITEYHGYLHVHHNVEHLGASAFLMAVRGRLFTVDEMLAVTEHRQPYEALGSGEEVAIGAMKSLLSDDLDYVPDNKLAAVAQAGIDAAAKYTNFVGGDIDMVRTVVYTEEEKRLAKSILGE